MRKVTQVTINCFICSYRTKKMKREWWEEELAYNEICWEARVFSPDFPLHYCDECGKSFRTRQNLDKHMVNRLTVNSINTYIIKDVSNPNHYQILFRTAIHISFYNMYVSKKCSSNNIYLICVLFLFF